MVFSKIFKRDDAQPAQPAAPAKPFAEQVQEWLVELAWYERECSGYLSTVAYSHLRLINDLVEASVPFLANYSIRPEEEYILEQTVRDYIPNALKLFVQLPEEDRAPGSKEEKMLLKQCGKFEKSMRELITTMENNVKADLATHTTFVENRFANPV